MRSATLLLLGAVMAKTAAAADNPTFMMVSGISAAEEMCLTNGGVGMDGADVMLEPCAAAVAAGDGRELWQRLPNGQVAHAMDHKCMSVAGDAVVQSACDGAASWEAQGNGQLKLGQAGDRCLSQKGSTSGMEDVAARGAIACSSSADVVAHGANMAVDGSSNTFWASALDPAGPVELTADVGGQRKLSEMQIDWEFPAKAFSVSVSVDGVKWSEVYATDSNVLSSNHIALGLASASKVKVLMHQAAGHFRGHALYGIRGLAILAPRLQSVVEDCASGAKSNDARDKYFATFVGEFASCSSKSLRSELPSLEAARASVAAVIAELADLLPKLGSCHGAKAFLTEPNAPRYSSSSSLLVQHRAAGTSAAQLARKVDDQNGIDTAGVSALLKEARKIIVAARSALF